MYTFKISEHLKDEKKRRELAQRLALKTQACPCQPRSLFLRIKLDFLSATPHTAVPMRGVIVIHPAEVMRVVVVLSDELAQELFELS